MSLDSPCLTHERRHSAIKGSIRANFAMTSAPFTAPVKSPNLCGFRIECLYVNSSITFRARGRRAERLISRSVSGHEDPPQPPSPALSSYRGSSRMSRCATGSNDGLALPCKLLSFAFLRASSKRLIAMRVHQVWQMGSHAQPRWTKHSEKHSCSASFRVFTFRTIRDSP